MRPPRRAGQPTPGRPRRQPRTADRTGNGKARANRHRQITADAGNDKRNQGRRSRTGRREGTAGSGSGIRGTPAHKVAAGETNGNRGNPGHKVTVGAASVERASRSRRRRVKRWLAFLGLCVGFLFVGASPIAEAQPVPPIPQGCPGGPAGPALPGTECPDGSVPTPIPAGCEGSPLTGPPIAGSVCPDGTLIPGQNDTTPQTPRDASADDRLAEMFALDNADEHPLSSYDIGCDEGAWNAFLRKMWCGAQALPFALGKWFIGIGTELLSWALEFKVAESLAPMAGLLSRVYETSLVGPLDIADLAWTLALLLGGWHLMRGRFTAGIREIATTFIIAVFGAIVLANPQGYLEGSIALAQNTSGAVLEAVDGAMSEQPAQDATAVRERLGVVLRRSFVAEPYDLINWGAPLTGECATARDEILREGPWGGEDRPREIMREHGCEQQAAFNERPTDNRAVSSLTVAGAAGLVTILTVVLALAVFAAQITLVALFSGASMAWAIALFPGGRGILWWWISRLVWAVLITFTSVFLLSWIAITVTVILDNTTEVSIVQRCLIVIMIVAVAFRFRSTVDKAVDNAAARVGATLNALYRPPAPAVSVSSRAASDGGGFAPLSWSPTKSLVAGAATAGAIATVAQANADRAKNVSTRAVRSSRAVGSGAFRSTQAVARAPQRVTQRASEVREKLARARVTRDQWARTARHPIASMRSSRSAANESSNNLGDWM